MYQLSMGICVQVSAGCGACLGGYAAIAAVATVALVGSAVAVAASNDMLPSFSAPVLPDPTP